MPARGSSANSVLPSRSLRGLVRSAVRGERGARSSQHRALGKWYSFFVVLATAQVLGASSQVTLPGDLERACPLKRPKPC